MLYIGYNVSIT